MLYFDNLKVISKLGEGGMSEVYLVQDEKENLVALKNLKKNYLNNPISKARFKNESFAVKKLNHPNIIKIYKPAHRTNVSNGRNSYQSLSYSMEYFAARSLKELITNKNLNDGQTDYLIIKILDALDYCHQRRVYHRDLKPANILIRKNNSEIDPVITDFGIAKFKNKELTNYTNLTMDVSILGAPSYMSPEQIRNPRNIDHRSDLYSLGIILYEMTTGLKPFRGSRNEILDQQLMRNALPPSRINPNIKPSLEKTILALLEKDTRKRPQSAAQVKNMFLSSERNKISVKLPANNKIIISLYRNTNFLKSISYDRPPVIIGKYLASQNVQNKFPINDTSGRIDSIHCKITDDGNNTITIEDLSRLGIIVNNIKVKRSKVVLEKNYNEVKLPNHYLLKIKTIPERNRMQNLDNKHILFISIGLGLLFITIIILLILH